MAYNGDQEKDLMVQYLDQKTMSFQTLIDAIRNFEDNCWRNGIDPKDVPVTIETGGLHYAIPWFGVSLGVGRGARVSIKYFSSEKCMPIVPDIRPDGGGEYWQSRGVGYPDVSGFVKSKQAGERINQMVDNILGPLHFTHLDYRETEPTWIQYKFHQEEFDCEKLDKLSKENNGIITENIIRECVLNKNVK